MINLIAYREPGEWNCGSENLVDRLNFWIHATILKDLQDGKLQAVKEALECPKKTS